jgi:antirestriction protein ArdC
MLKTYTVFNFEQIEWDPEHMPKGIELKDINPEAACAEAACLIKKTGATIKHGGGRAFYRSSDDFIGMPEPGAFEDANAYWATLLHEVTHWTGHASRCARDLQNRFGDEKYAAEELVAEMGSAFLCTDLGIQGKIQHASYVSNWIKVLRNDKYALFTAARLAREAVAFAKGEKASKTKTTVSTSAAETTAKAA